MKQPYVGTLTAPTTPPHTWPQVTHEGVIWLVSPVYVSPVARVDIPALLDEYDCELPTAGLVDAIWAKADLKLDPWRLVRRPMTWENASSSRAFADQRERIAREIAGRPFTLLVGSHKDFVATKSGRADLYGLHTLDGVPIQRPPTSHGPLYTDCSQGLRLVRRVSAIVTDDGRIA